MKKLLFILILFVFNVFYGDFTSYTNEIKKFMEKETEKILSESKRHTGFYMGSGNIFPVDTSGYFSAKVGTGGGMFFPNILPKEEESYNEISSEVIDFREIIRNNSIPSFYNLTFFKLGTPVKNLDIGMRVGFLFELQNIYQLILFGGVESRYIILKDVGGFFNLDARLSADFNYVRFRDYCIEYLYSWSSEVGIVEEEKFLSFDSTFGGCSLGTKIVSGINIPFGASIFCGIGGNLNIGSVNSRFESHVFIKTNDNEQKADLEHTAMIPYDLFDLRGIVGAKIFFINVGYEYNFLTGDMALTIIPLYIVF